ncbi:unnamed protein product, partial [Cyprideis torosa]
MPAAIDRGTDLVVRRSDDRLIKLASANFELVAFLSPEEIDQKFGDHWINYPLGVIQQFRRRGINVSGLEFYYHGNIPNGAGLSSSASIEVVTAAAINACLDCGLAKSELVTMALAAENDFVGVNCGVMDQFAVAMAEADKVMLLDCQQLQCEQLPLAIGDYRL